MRLERFAISFSCLRMHRKSGPFQGISSSILTKEPADIRDLFGNLYLFFDGKLLDFDEAEGFPVVGSKVTYPVCSFYYLFFGLASGIVNSKTETPQQVYIDRTMDAPELWFKKVGNSVAIWFVGGEGTVSSGKRFGDHECDWVEFSSAALAAAEKFVNEAKIVVPGIENNPEFAELSAKVAKLKLLKGRTD